MRITFQIENAPLNGIEAALNDDAELLLDSAQWAIIGFFSLTFMLDCDVQTNETFKSLVMISKPHFPVPKTTGGSQN